MKKKYLGDIFILGIYLFFHFWWTDIANCKIINPLAKCGGKKRKIINPLSKCREKKRKSFYKYVKYFLEQFWSNWTLHHSSQ